MYILTITLLFLFSFRLCTPNPTLLSRGWLFFLILMRVKYHGVHSEYAVYQVCLQLYLHFFVFEFDDCSKFLSLHKVVIQWMGEKQTVSTSCIKKKYFIIKLYTKFIYKSTTGQSNIRPQGSHRLSEGISWGRCGSFILKSYYWYQSYGPAQKAVFATPSVTLTLKIQTWK